MTCLLDTNACIALVNGAPARVRERFVEVAAQGERMTTSSVVVFELWYGVAKSLRRRANEQRLRAFLSGPIEVLELDAADAREAGLIRATLEGAGTPIGAYDLLIAGQALRHQARLITANTGEFARVPALRWEDWSG